MIFQISPKLSVARDLPQTCRQTVPQTRPCNSMYDIILRHPTRKRMEPYSHPEGRGHGAESDIKSRQNVDDKKRRAVVGV